MIYISLIDPLSYQLSRYHMPATPALFSSAEIMCRLIHDAKILLK